MVLVNTNSRPSIETLECRQLLSGFAPASIGGATIAANIASGTAPLDTAGAFTVQPLTTGNFAIVNATGGATNSSGTFNYFKTGDDTGSFLFATAFGVSYNDTLTFTTATTGTYSIAPVISGAAGSQTGTFVFTPASAPVEPDLTISIVKAPTGNVVSGDKGKLAVSVNNVGTSIAQGEVLIFVDVTPTGGLGDRTSATSLPIGKTLRLKPDGSKIVSVPFTYPAVATKDYRLVTVVEPVSPLVESDMSNDTAISTQTVNITAPLPDLAATSLSISGVPSTGAISGAKAHAVLTIKNDGNLLMAGGPVTISLFAADNTAEVNPTSVLPKPIERRLHLVPDASIKVPLTFTMPNVGATTGEYFFGTVSTAGGTLTDDNSTNNTVATITPLSVGPAVVTLRDVLTGVLPPSVVGGKVGHDTLQINNDGNVLFHGAVPITVAISPDGTLASGTVVESKTLTLSIPPGHFHDIPLKFDYPSDLPNAEYDLVAQNGATTTPVKGTIPVETIDVPASNVAVSSTMVNVSQPYVTLAATFNTLPGTAFTVGQRITVDLTLMNSGNVPAKEIYTIQLIASPSSNPTDPGAVDLTKLLTKHLSLGSDDQTVLAFKIKMPALTAGTEYLFVAPINAAAVPDITDPIVTAVSSSSTPFTVG